MILTSISSSCGANALPVNAIRISSKVVSKPGLTVFKSYPTFMNKIKQNHIFLKRGETLKLPASSSLDLVCASGSAWITAARDETDYVVTAGASIHLDGKQAVVIEG